MLKEIESDTKIFFLTGAVIFLVRILFAKFVGIWFFPVAYHDDALFIRYANFHNHFIEQTLPFNDTLLKDMGFPVFLNLVNWSHLQYVDVISVLWGISAILSVILFSKLTGIHNRRVQLLIFVFILFAPAAFDGWCGSRLYRSSAMTPLYFIFFDMLALLFVKFFADDKINLKKLFFFQFILGLIFTLTFYIKEDGIWLLLVLTAVIVLCLIKIFFSSKNSFQIAALMLPLLIFFAGTTLYKSVNQKYFGVYEINTRTEGETGKFIKLVYKIQSPERNTSIWAPADAILKAFDASETLRANPALKENFIHSAWLGGDIFKNPIYGDFLTWVTLSAIKDSGTCHNLAEQEEFFKKVNAELETAFENGTLQKETKFQLVSSMGGRNFDEMLELIKPTLAQFAMHTTLYEYSARFGLEDMGNEEVVLWASDLTNMNLTEGRPFPKIARAFVRILFVIYAILQSVLFIAALTGFFTGILNLLQSRIKLDLKKFLIIPVMAGILLLAFVYAFAISWFSSFLGIGEHMKFYSVGLVPMLMTFEILGTYLFIKHYRNLNFVSRIINFV